MSELYLNPVFMLSNNPHSLDPPVHVIYGISVGILEGPKGAWPHNKREGLIWEFAEVQEDVWPAILVDAGVRVGDLSNDLDFGANRPC
jgi:hypothetical protein